VVKAPVINSKNAAQHYADLHMLEDKEEIRDVFWNSESQVWKEIECARVDGSFDKGPSHCEVRYWWTIRHLVTGSRMTLVMSRNSGASYKSRVELQNGCLALGHSGLFIPSTLNGSCMLNGGNIDYDLLRKNLHAAISVYISRVDKSPCAGTVINLYRGADSSVYQEETEIFKVFFKGKKSEKEKLKKDHPEKYSRAQAIWSLRNRHMRKDLVQKYIFCLSCCYEQNCEHPLCKKGKPEKEPTWYIGGPPLSFLPIPSPDPNRHYGQEQCHECDGACYGHYRKLDDLWKFALEGGDVVCSPPSEVILAEYNKVGKIPDGNRVQDIAKRTLLAPEEVSMWFNHLHTIAENRKKGAAKAAETRRARKGRTKSRVDV
jgi:hypothetical protein